MKVRDIVAERRKAAPAEFLEALKEYVAWSKFDDETLRLFETAAGPLGDIGTLYHGWHAETWEQAPPALDFRTRETGVAGGMLSVSADYAAAYLHALPGIELEHQAYCMLAIEPHPAAKGIVVNDYLGDSHGCADEQEVILLRPKFKATGRRRESDPELPPDAEVWEIDLRQVL